MATLSEVLRGVSPDVVVLAGAPGLGREVRRIVLVRPASELAVPIGGGDLVVYAIGANADNAEAADRAVTILSSAGIAGVLTDLAPSRAAIQAADKSGTPLLAIWPGSEPTHLCALLSRSLEHHEQALGPLQMELHLDFARLSRAGATPTMVLEHLVEVTGKTGVLQPNEPGSQVVRQAVLQDLDGAPVRRAIQASDATAQRWMVQAADATVANVLYLELPADRLIRLLAPVWIDARVSATVSLFARSDELGGRDRVALVAAAQAIASASAEVPLQVGVRARPYGVVVLRARDANVQQLAEAAHLRFAKSEKAVTIGREDVGVCLPYVSRVKWGRELAEWHAQLSADFGLVTLGHAVRCGGESSDARPTAVQAAEAALLGEYLFGPGQVTSYADAQLARFMLGNHQTHELQALYERAAGKLAAEDLKRSSELVTTLEAYCETVATQGTAERLGVHRNTVLYRLKLIEEITAVDLDDGPSRLLLQLGLLAGRLVHRSIGVSSNASAAFVGPRLVKAGRRPRTRQARTA